MNRYMPNDSPFGDAYADFLAHEWNPGTSDEDVTLDVYADSELDEFAACADHLRSMPHYADDAALAAFAHDARSVLATRRFETDQVATAAAREALFRTPEVRRVLSAVRVTGRSAHPQHGEGFVSPLVRAVAAELRMSAVSLQVQVNAYADAQRAHVEAASLAAAHAVGRALAAAGL